MDLNIKFHDGKTYIKNVRKDAVVEHQGRIISVLRQNKINSPVSIQDDTTIVVEGNVEDLLKKLGSAFMGKKKHK